MLTIFGDPSGKHCDGVTRRNFLTVGGLALGGLTLPGFLQSRALAAPRAHKLSAPADKSVIMVCLGGGPSQIDTYDMRPEAPAEYRGEFSPIASSVPGIQMCELMPRQAAVAD